MLTFVCVYVILRHIGMTERLKILAFRCKGYEFNSKFIWLLAGCYQKINKYFKW